MECSDLKQLCDRIDARGNDPVWISKFSREEILQRGEASASHQGCLAGATFAIKDNIDLHGLPTTAACREFAYTPQRSATVVQRLIDAGAIPLGKTNLDQFAIWRS